MTIHSTHPFADPDPDPVRRVRGRLPGAVGVLTTGALDRPGSAAGLTVTSLLLALGEPAYLVTLVDPDSDLADALDLPDAAPDARALLTLLTWEQRALAEAFAGTAPAPGGPFRQAPFESTPWGPRPAGAAAWLGLTEPEARPLGWSLEVRWRIDEAGLTDPEPVMLGHRRGRFHRLVSASG